MRSVMACQRMANAFRNSEAEIDQIIVRLLDEPLQLFATEEEVNEIVARLPKEAVLEQTDTVVLTLTNGSVILVEP